MVRFSWSSGKTSSRPLVIFRWQNKGRVRILERQKEEEGERNLQNLDLLNGHSHQWDHSKISQLSWGHLPMAPSWVFLKDPTN